MLCNSCGLENKNDYKFCIECGEELNQFTLNDNPTCDGCGAVNDKGNNYCRCCGTRLNVMQSSIDGQTSREDKAFSKKYAEKKRNILTGTKSNPEKIFYLKPAYIIIPLIVIGVVYLIISKESSAEIVEPKPVLEQTSSNPIIEARVFEIASKFVCSCGTCGEESLETCKCPRAVEERSLIRNYVQKDIKTEDIVLSLANYYGFLKAIFAKDYPKVDKSKIFTALSTDLKNDLINKNIFTNKTLATNADRLTIISAFNCPCGKCGVDELKDCDCSHLRGAKEVKGFIDKIITESKYSASEIISIVNNKYGGKKI